MAYRQHNLNRERDDYYRQRVSFTLGINRNIAEGNEGFARDLARKSLRIGQRQQLDNLNFEADARQITDAKLNRAFEKQMKKIYPDTTKFQISQAIEDKTTREKEILIEEMVKASITGKKPPQLIQQIIGTRTVKSSGPIPPSMPVERSLLEQTMKRLEIRDISGARKFLQKGPEVTQMSADEIVKRADEAGVVVPDSILQEIATITDPSQISLESIMILSRLMAPQQFAQAPQVPLLTQAEQEAIEFDSMFGPIEDLFEPPPENPFAGLQTSAARVRHQALLREALRIQEMEAAPPAPAFKPPRPRIFGQENTREMRIRRELLERLREGEDVNVPPLAPPPFSGPSHSGTVVAGGSSLAEMIQHNVTPLQAFNAPGDPP